MPLDKPSLNTAILNIMNSMSARETDPAQAREDFATMLSDVIDAFVKTGTVSVTVSTTGTASAQTGTGTGSIS